MPKLQLVFCLRLKAIEGKVFFHIAVVVIDLGGILGFLLLFLVLAIYGRSGISSSCGRARLFTIFLSVLLLFFFPGLLKKLLGLRALFDLLGLIFKLRSLFISLIIPRIETHLQRSFLFMTPLI